MHRLIFYFAIFIVVSCSSDDSHTNDTIGFDFSQIPQVSLEVEFSIWEFNNGDFFGYVSNVLSGSNGTIFVSDPTTQKIHLFDGDGKYSGFLGGHGAGPGEFRRISNMALLTPDTLQVLDITLARITLFAHSGNKWAKIRSFDPPLGSNISPELEIYSFREFQKSAEGYIATFESTISSTSADNFIKECFYVFDEAFNPIRTIDPLCHNKLELIMHRYSDASVQSVSAMPIPEGFKTLSTVTKNGEIVSIWTGNPILSIHNIFESNHSEFEFHSTKIGISDEAKTTLTHENVPNNGGSNIQLEPVINHIPDHKGFAEQIIVDDNNQIWILSRSDGDNLIWHIYDFDGALLGKVNHPGGKFSQIKNNKIYTFNNTGDEGPAFSVFRINN